MTIKDEELVALYGPLSEAGTINQPHAERLRKVYDKAIENAARKAEEVSTYFRSGTNGNYEMSTREVRDGIDFAAQFIRGNVELTEEEDDFLG